MTFKEAIDGMKPGDFIYVELWSFYMLEDGTISQACSELDCCDDIYDNKEELLKSSFVKSLLKRKAEIEEL